MWGGPGKPGTTPHLISGQVREQREHADGGDAHDNLDDPKNDLLTLVEKVNEKTVTGACHVLVENHAA